MTTGNDGGVWSRFEHDPRDPSYAGMRASDRDRGVVLDALGEAYAEGRLDRDEHDERTTEVTRAKTYADLVPPLRDLTTDSSVPGTVPGDPDLRRQAKAYFRTELNEALFAFLVPNLICWVIFIWAGNAHGFPWPIFVTIPTLVNVLRVVNSRQQIIERRVQKLERKQIRSLGPGEPAADETILRHHHHQHRDEP